MAKDPRFNFYPDNWTGGTKRMSLEQKGAYLELLLLNFYCFSDNLAGFTKTEAMQTLSHATADATACAKLFDYLMPKFKTDGNFYWSERLRREFEKAKRTSDKQAETAKTGWEKRRKNKATADATALPIYGSGYGNGIVSVEKGGTGENESEQNPLKLPSNHKTQVGIIFSDLLPTDYLKTHHQRFYEETIMGKGLTDAEINQFNTTNKALYVPFTNEKHFLNAFAKHIRDLTNAKHQQTNSGAAGGNKGGTPGIRSGAVKNF